jgi:hypothetical protein
MFSNTLACAAIIFSVVTFAWTRTSAQASDRRSRIPVLVFVYETDHWLLRNVGNGPALNIVVAIKNGHEDSQWQKPTRIPPIGRDDGFRLSWLGDSGPAKIAATYEDFLAADTPGKSRFYTVQIEYDINSINPGRSLPDWGASQSIAHWEHSS